MKESSLFNRRLGVVLFIVLQLGGGFSKWSSMWWMNRRSIATFTLVNTVLTVTSELVTRSISSNVKNSPENAFIVRDDEGGIHVHKQSLINIFMTIFASIFGGPAYFMRSRGSRFSFFIGFGLVNSMFAQCLSHLFLSGAGAWFSFHRIQFDLAYTASIRFFMFEVARPFLLRFHLSLFGVGAVRVIQDFITTWIRVHLLDTLGFKG